MNEFRKIIIALILSATGCGPSLSTQVRYDAKPFDANEYRQEKDGVIVENKAVKQLPPSFYLKVQACNQNGQPAVNENGQAIMETASFASAGQTWYQMAITNQTGHVIRLSTAVIRLFDPANNQIEPLAKDDLAGMIQTNRPCPSSTQLVNQLRLLKMLDRNVEILPDTTITGWLAFNPTTWPLPGIWKLAIYEVPVATTEAGQVSKTTRFEVRNVVKKYVDTYRQESPFGEKKLVETEESSD